MSASVVWCGMGGGSYAAKQLRPLIESLGMKLTIISEWDDADVRWDISTWQNEVLKHDIVICPTDQNKFPYKGNNKVTHFMALGIPVIASPLQSYREVIEHGVTGYIADNLSDWKKYLSILRDNQTLRKKMADKAKEKVSIPYSASEASSKVMSIFADRDNTIDIIIPNYNNTKYLLETLESLKRNTAGLYKVAIVDSSSDDMTPIEEFVSRNKSNHALWRLPTRSCFSKAVNLGMEKTGSKWVMIGNNDLLFTKDWDLPLRDFLSKNPNHMVQPLSNCDKGWLHNYELKTKSGVSLNPGIHTLDNVSVEDIEQSASTLTRNEIVAREKLAFYCVTFHRRLLSLIGNLDDEFLNGGEDFDYCYRARKAGWSFASIHNSFVFHFGGKTRKVSENENYDRHHKEDKFNNDRLNRKLSKSVLAFYLGAGWEKWDEKNLKSGGIGGSETAAIWMARELSKFGYQVKVFADPSEDHKDESGLDVEYIHHSKFKRYAETTFIDFLICSRTVNPLHELVHSYRKYVWVHDVFIGPDRKMDVCLDDVTKYLCLSEWHRDFLMEHHGIPKSKIFMTTNGVDPSRYEKPVPKIPGQIFYSSSPDRGLDTLLYLGEFLKDRVPNFKIKVAYGFNNWEKAVLFRNNPQEVEEMKRLKEALKRPFVDFLGRIDQNELAKVQMESVAWFYPTRFHETNCITAIEAGWAKNAIVASHHAGLITTVKDGGTLIKGDAYTQEYREKFLDEAVKVLTDEDYQKGLQEKAYQRMTRFTWAAVAQQWHEMFQQDKYRELQ